MIANETVCGKRHTLIAVMFLEFVAKLQQNRLKLPLSIAWSGTGFALRLLPAQQPQAPELLALSVLDDWLMSCH